MARKKKKKKRTRTLRATLSDPNFNPVAKYHWRRGRWRGSSGTNVGGALSLHSPSPPPPWQLTHDVHEPVADPPVHPAVDDRVDAGVGDGQDVDHGEDVREQRRAGQVRVQQSQRLEGELH